MALFDPPKVSVLVTIRLDGQIEFGPDYHPDEAAREFWKSIGRHAPDTDGRRIIRRLLEAFSAAFEDEGDVSASADTEWMVAKAEAHAYLRAPSG